MVDKIKQWAEAAKTVGMPWSLAFALLGLLAWVIHENNQMQAQTLTVIQQNTAAIDALRDEMRRNH